MLILYILHIIGILGSFLPLLPSDYWLIRSQDYIKYYYLLLNIVLFIISLSVFSYSIIHVIIIIVSSFTIIYLTSIILPFTNFYKKEVLPTKSEGDVITIFIYNVLQKNKDYQKLIDKVDELDPDIIFLCETNQEWKDNIGPIIEKYPFYIDEIREDTYGIITMTKFECLEGGINNFVTTQIPSTEMLIEVNNKHVRIFGLHPKPPMPNEAKFATNKDKELKQLAEYIASNKQNEYKIVFGDLNDVAWSPATREFRMITNLLDPRIGRSFYPTFPTHMPLKIPLDHIFCSNDMYLKSFEVVENLGSDHYPLFVKLQIT